jgi:hypothetical protein
VRVSAVRYCSNIHNYKDVVWCIRDYLEEPLDEYIPVKPGAKIYKGWQEYVLYQDGIKAAIDNNDFKMKFKKVT